MHPLQNHTILKKRSAPAREKVESRARPLQGPRALGARLPQNGGVKFFGRAAAFLCADETLAAFLRADKTQCALEV